MTTGGCPYCDRGLYRCYPDGTGLMREAYRDANGNLTIKDRSDPAEVTLYYETVLDFERKQHQKTINLYKNTLADYLVMRRECAMLNRKIRRMKKGNR